VSLQQVFLYIHVVRTLAERKRIGWFNHQGEVEVIIIDLTCQWKKLIIDVLNIIASHDFPSSCSDVGPQ